MEEIVQILKQINDKIDRLENHLIPVQSNWLDIKQTINYLHVSQSKLRKMISAGEIPFRRVGANGKIIFNRKQLDLWLIYSKKAGFTKREREQAEAWI